MTCQPFTLQKDLLGYTIRAQVTPLDEGLHVLLTGGQRSHVGAVCLAQKGQVCGEASYPAHREQVVAKHWAEVLSRQLQCPVTLVCGIHYDHATRAQISQVLEVCDELLEEISGLL